MKNLNAVLFFDLLIVIALFGVAKLTDPGAFQAMTIIVLVFLAVCVTVFGLNKDE